MALVVLVDDELVEVVELVVLELEVVDVVELDVEVPQQLLQSMAKYLRLLLILSAVVGCMCEATPFM